MTDKPILCLDFDGVIHSYTSGWQGVTKIPDLPVPGALDFIQVATNYFTVCIYSARSKMPSGRIAMREWLDMQLRKEGLTPRELGHLMNVIQFPDHKPAAFVGIDDRVLTFNGKFPNMETLRQFKPWYAK